MTVFDSSRFKGAYILHDKDSTSEPEGVMYLSPFRDNIYKKELSDLELVFEAGMRIDLLAKEYYGNETYDWVIMDANPKYLTPFEIKVGDKIVIPNPQRVMNNV